MVQHLQMGCVGRQSQAPDWPWVQFGATRTSAPRQEPDARGHRAGGGAATH